MLRKPFDLPLYVDDDGKALETDAQARVAGLFRELRHRICTTRYPPGQVLHEAALSEEFEVARSSIRSAFSKLEQVRLLEIRHGVGAQVTGIRDEDIVDAYQLRMMLAAGSGPYLETPFPDHAIGFLEECEALFAQLEEGDVIGFGDVNTYYFTGVLDLIGSRYVRNIQLALFFETARVWIIRLPHMNWQHSIQSVLGEAASFRLSIEQDDPESLAFQIRTSIRNGLRHLSMDVTTGKDRD